MSGSILPNKPPATIKISWLKVAWVTSLTIKAAATPAAMWVKALILISISREQPYQCDTHHGTDYVYRQWQATEQFENCPVNQPMYQRGRNHVSYVHYVCAQVSISMFLYLRSNLIKSSKTSGLENMKPCACLIPNRSIKSSCSCVSMPSAMQPIPISCCK